MDKFESNNIRDLFVGIDKKIPLLGNINVAPINFDNAATTPTFKSVINRIEEMSDCYGSIGRGLGQKSEMCTKVYEECRKYILKFFNVNENNYTAIFVSNTTDGINKLANTIIEKKDDILITTRMEHHSNDLPWRCRCKVDYLEVDEKGRLILSELEEKLKKYNGQVKYISVTAASNVTGYVNDIKSIAKLAHKYGALIIVDGAQIVAHKKIEIESELPDECIDFFVFSAHKLYAPFGSGVIIGRKEIFDKFNSSYKGGGAVKAVFDYDEILLGTPEKYEPGTPNFFGVIALVEAIKQLSNIGFENIENHEKILISNILDGMKRISKLILYGDVENVYDKLGIVVFNIDGIYNEDVAHLLAKFRAISVRQGAFCAHPYVNRLLNLRGDEGYRYLTDKSYKMPGMVRVSFGVYNTVEEINIFLETLEWICKL